jgi:hypothetical protein
LKDFAMPRESARSLRASAQDKGGYFSAKASGNDYSHLECHVFADVSARILTIDGT